MLKKAWITPNDQFDLHTLTLESKKTEPIHERLWISESCHPANPMPEHPLRHVIVIHHFSTEDLTNLYNTIGNFINSR